MKSLVISLLLATSTIVQMCFAQDPFVERDGQLSRWRPQLRMLQANAEDEDPTLAYQEGPESNGRSRLLPVATDPSADLFNRLNQMQAELDSLRGDGAVESSITNPTRGLLPGEKRSTDVPRIEDIKSTPSYPRVRLSGFFQADAGFFSQDTLNTQTLGNIQDVWGFRRTRLAAVGDVSEAIGYMLEMDFSFPGRPSFMDVWADIRHVPLLGTVRVGQWRMPFGMDELTSVRELQFLERGLGFAQAPFRQVGVGFHDQNEAQTVTWDVAGYKFPTDVFGDSQGDRGYGTSARITTIPFYDEEENRLIHLGADYSYITPGNRSITYRNQAEFGGPFIVNPLTAIVPPGSPQSLAGNLASLPFPINTGAVPVGHFQLFNAEAAAAIGSWYMQSEARYAVLSQLSGRNSILPTFYAQTGYFLTGEKRSYNKLSAVFGRVKPLHKWGEDGGLGAFDAAFRYSYADFNGSGFQGNRLNDLTFGMNWYLNQYMKFQFNYIHSILADAKFGVSDFNTYAVLRPARFLSRLTNF